MSKYHDVPIEVSFVELEMRVLRRWDEDKVFERSLSRRAHSPRYVFDDGPPFATGLPHYGHILTSYVKDVVPRYFTMKGYHVPRRWGWDCHGLPVELEVEKELGFSSRVDILRYGVGPFNTRCREMVSRYATEWRSIIHRLGRWVDFDNAYKTMDTDYMESVMWCFQQLHDRGLVYEGSKVVAYCIRCQTPLSNFEARLDDAYRLRKDPSAFVRFPLRDADKEALLVWTTTPWTLPSNVAVAVHPDAEYVRMERDGDSVWLATATLDTNERLLAGYRVAERASGREFVGRAYLPPFPYFQTTPDAFVVLASDTVSTDEGTGVLHLAPAFGEEDQAICSSAGIVGPNPILDDGRFDSSVSDFAGLSVFEAIEPIHRALKTMGRLFHQEPYTHNYPHCWRCDNPLMYRSIRTWFIKVTAIKDRMLSANAQIRWVPEAVKDGRFGNWLANARDWAVSRSRFWGSPIPVWRCAGCDATEVIGTIDELTRRSGRAVVDLHRPDIDTVTFPCTACGQLMRRVPDVLDCWFESGAMPYGQVHYPFEQQQELHHTFPADFVVEYVAQTRGWFYTLVVLATALFDQPPFKNVVCHGVILAHDGRKMSKRLKNYPDPVVLVNEHGSDALRTALLSSPVISGNDIRFNPDAVRDAVRRYCIPLWNSLHYFTSYARIDAFEPTGNLAGTNRLDRYLLHETDTLRNAIETSMEQYDFATAYRSIEEYIVMLSTWYIRLSRPRLWGEGLTGDKRAAYESLHEALTTLSRLIAPFLPFLAESIHTALGADESVHVQEWPAPKPHWRDDAIAEEMRLLRTVVRLGRSIRERHEAKHRHPLRHLALAGVPESVIELNRELLMTELNVKGVSTLSSPEEYVERRIALNPERLGRRLRADFARLKSLVASGRYVIQPDGWLHADDISVMPDEFEVRFVAREGNVGIAAEGNLVLVLDLVAYPELALEGQARDLNRKLQDLRKEARLKYSDRVDISVVGPSPIPAVLDQFETWLAEQLLATRIERTPLNSPLASADVHISGVPVQLSLRRSGAQAC